MLTCPLMWCASVRMSSSVSDAYSIWFRYSWNKPTFRNGLVISDVPCFVPPA